MPEFATSELTVLLIEDDPDDQLLFREYAEELGEKAPRVLMAETCEAGRKILASENIDVCYVDYRLGVESGLEFIALASKEFPATPFVQLTGQTGPYIDGNALLAGARDFMNKSELSSDRLLRSLRYVVTQARHENLIRDQREVVNGLLYSLGEVFWILDETSGLLLEVGPGIEPLTGHAPSDFIDDFSLWDRLVHAEHRQKRNEMIRGTVMDQTNDMEYLLSDSEGNPHLVRERVRRMKNTDGSFWVVGVSRDITHEKESHSRLLLFQQVMREVEEVILVTDNRLEDPDGPFIVYVNPAFTRMTGYEMEEVVGKSPKLLQGPKTDREILDRLKESLRRGEEFAADNINYRKDGTTYIVHWSISPVRDADGNVEYYASIQRDVTLERQRQAQEQRDQRLESLGNLVGGVAHDLNNILSPIMMGAGMLPDADSPEQRATISDSMLESAERASGVVGQLLAFARGGNQKRKYITLEGILKEVYRIGQETFPKHIQLHLKQDKDLWVVHASENEMQQVVLNLALNAKDCLEDGDDGHIELSVENRRMDPKEAESILDLDPGDYVRIRVKDNGPGMSREVLDNIFDPFFTTKPEGKGTGLGLSSSLGIVQSHQGGVHVESAEGLGTCFHIYLPAHPGKQKEEDTEDKSFIHGEGQNILVVDDEAVIVALVADMLEEYGYTGHGVTSSLEAVKYFKQDPYRIDLLLTDVMMPGMDGAELTRQLREIRPDLPVLAMSGYVRHEKLDEFREVGISDILPKPIKLEKIMRAVNKAVPPP